MRLGCGPAQKKVISKIITFFWNTQGVNRLHCFYLLLFTMAPVFVLGTVLTATMAQLYFGPNILLKDMDVVAIKAQMAPCAWPPEFFDTANVDYDLDALKLLIAALLVACSWPLGMFL